MPGYKWASTEKEHTRENAFLEQHNFAAFFKMSIFLILAALYVIAFQRQFYKKIWKIRRKT